MNCRHKCHPDDRQTFCIARREYKHLLKRKRKDFNKALLEQLLASTNNQKKFWENVHDLSFRKRYVVNDITLDDWFDHFKSLLDKDNNLENEMEVEDIDCYFNRPITKEEVLLSLRRIKKKKAAGPDGIIGEMLKYAGDDVVNIFVSFFQCFISKRHFSRKMDGRDHTSSA